MTKGVKGIIPLYFAASLTTTETAGREVMEEKTVATLSMGGLNTATMFTKTENTNLPMSTEVTRMG